MAYNLAANSTDDCAFLQQATMAWLSSFAIVSDNYVKTGSYEHMEDIYVLWAEVRPVRCDWQRSDGVITNCDYLYAGEMPGLTVACDFWRSVTRDSPDDISDNFLAKQIGIRTGEALDLDKSSRSLSGFDGSVEETTFYVRSVFNESHAVSLA